ncbi:MAG: hypothetical protein MJE68_15505, partial [Proteobacteria bacterium]|nr:hypothetical protein [Pseudomonadota bacterium]
MGSPLRAQEYTSEFVKNNPPLVLTKSKCIEQDNIDENDTYDDWNADPWDNDTTITSGTYATAHSPTPCASSTPTVDLDQTTPKRPHQASKNPHTARRGFPP